MGNHPSESQITVAYLLCAQGDRAHARRAIARHLPRATVRDAASVDEVAEDPGACLVLGMRDAWRGKAFLTSGMPIYLYCKDEFFAPEDGDDLARQRDEAVRAGDLARAKSLNGLIIELDFLGMRTAMRALPDYIQIETTSYCNARCIMCSHYPNGNRGARHLDERTRTSLTDVLSVSRTVSLNGMGEPFVNPQCVDLIDTYAALGNEVVTNTNLSVLDERILRCINEHFEWLEVSCDGATAATYESIRRGLSFARFRENLRTLQERCPTVRRHIATVVMRQNVHEMPAMVKLAFEAGASVVTFMTLNANLIIGNDADRMVHYPRVLEYYSARALERGEELGIPVVVPNAAQIDRTLTRNDIQDELAAMRCLPAYKDEAAEGAMFRVARTVDAYLAEHDETQRDTVPSPVRCQGICDWLLHRSYIDLDGNVAMCCRNQSFHLGNACDEGAFAPAWNSPFAQKLRRIFYAGYIPESCLGCGLLESGNLRHLAVEMTPAFYDEPHYKARQRQILGALIERAAQGSDGAVQQGEGTAEAGVAAADEAGTADGTGSAVPTAPDAGGAGTACNAGAGAVPSPR